MSKNHFHLRCNLTRHLEHLSSTPSPFKIPPSRFPTPPSPSPLPCFPLSPSPSLFHNLRLFTNFFTTSGSSIGRGKRNSHDGRLLVMIRIRANTQLHLIRPHFTAENYKSLHMRHETACSDPHSIHGSTCPDARSPHALQGCSYMHSRTCKYTPAIHVEP
jgi:hypothetical protein